MVPQDYFDVYYSPVPARAPYPQEKLGETACIGVPDKGLPFVTSPLVAIPYNPHNFSCAGRVNMFVFLDTSPCPQKYLSSIFLKTYQCF